MSKHFRHFIELNWNLDSLFESKLKPILFLLSRVPGIVDAAGALTVEVLHDHVVDSHRGTLDEGRKVAEVVGEET